MEKTKPETSTVLLPDWRKNILYGENWVHDGIHLYTSSGLEQSLCEIRPTTTVIKIKLVDGEEDKDWVVWHRETPSAGDLTLPDVEQRDKWVVFPAGFEEVRWIKGENDVSFEFKLIEDSKETVPEEKHSPEKPFDIMKSIRDFCR